MKHIQNIRINNFRGIKELSLDKLCPITVFLGENSVGKSTILETLFMVTGPSNPFMPIRITALRAHGIYDIKDVNYMFYDSDFSQIPTLEATLNNEEHRLISLFPTYSVEESSSMDDFASSGNNQVITGINCKFEVVNRNGLYSGESSFVRNQDGKLNPQIDTNYKEEINSVSLSSYNQTGSLIEEYDALVKAGKKELALKALQNFDERINAIESTKDGLFVGYNQLQHMVPLSMAGDGIQKFLSIAIRAYNPSIDIIFIDEIENGLHFSAHHKLWKCIIETAKNLDKQFFISTHNEETLKCLSSLVNSDDLSKIINVITLARTDESIIPYYLSGNGLQGAMENGVEIRK